MLKQIRAAIAHNMVTIAVMLTYLVASIRIAGHKSDVFKDLAHCLVGWLFGAGYVGKKWELVYLAWMITVVEVACFVYGLL